jgi:hypothetical protein
MLQCMLAFGPYTTASHHSLQPHSHLPLLLLLHLCCQATGHPGLLLPVAAAPNPECCCQALLLLLLHQQ